MILVAKVIAEQMSGMELRTNCNVTHLIIF